MTMANVYENVVEEFNKRNCKLLNSKDEYHEILKLAKKTMYKLNYIASCGHTHTVFYNSFKSRGTGVICPSCKKKEIGNNKKIKMQNNEMSKTCNIEQEHACIIFLCEFIHSDFEIIKSFDGCNVDLIFRPINVIENKWVGIQVKTTNARHLTYSFHMNNNNNDCLLFFYCCEDESMWLIPDNIIKNQKKVSIGYYKSKYNIYKVNKNNLFDKLNEYYYNSNKFSFENLNNPICVYQQREKLFRKYREEKINFINFYYENIKGTVYDFKIGDLKIQEKVTVMSKDNRFIFKLCKNNGPIQMQYNIGDNDFYWLNCDNKKIFFVIPEKILIDKGLIGNFKKYYCLKITIKETLHKMSAWIQPYMFDYDTIDVERLLTLLK